MTGDGAVLCVGGAVVDRKFQVLAAAVPGTSNPARAGTAHGGVARNVAQTLAVLGVPAALVSRVGDDESGRALLACLDHHGVDRSRVQVDPGVGTAQYVAVLDPDGSLVLGVADMQVLERMEAGPVEAAIAVGPPWLLTDCNPSAAVLGRILASARAHGRRLCVEATSVPKVVRLPGDLRGIEVFFCNRDEARAWLAARVPGPDERTHPGTDRDPVGAGDPDVALARRLRAAGAASVVLTRGARGLVLLDGDGARAVPAPSVPVVDVTGAGDALVAGTLAGLSRGDGLDAAAGLGLRLAAAVLTSRHSVVTGLPDDLRADPGHRVQDVGRHHRLEDR